MYDAFGCDSFHGQRWLYSGYYMHTLQSYSMIKYLWFLLRSLSFGQYKYNFSYCTIVVLRSLSFLIQLLLLTRVQINIDFYTEG
jgi:hypothetical protein